MLRRRFWWATLAFVVMVLTAAPAAAHANLSRSEPFANASLNEAPSEIRLWFTEPLESQYSRITLIDSNGTALSTPSSFIDSSDPHQLVLQPGTLEDGVYTVSWRALSSADGHVTQGSYAFSIGVAAPSVAGAVIADETAPPESVAVRWINLASTSLLIGSVGFWLFVWKPQQGQSRRLWILAGAGWLLVGGALLLRLVTQTVSVADTISLESMIQIATTTNFGTLWLIRVAFWLVIGLVLIFSPRDHRLLWVALACGAGLLLAHALSSHASAAQDLTVAVANDWLHLFASSMWLGGLAAFALVLVRSGWSAAQIGELVASFSNYARAVVAALVISGLYAAWLHVGSVEALLGTVYGRALLVKLLLFVPLVLIAGVNLLLTRRALLDGNSVWIGRLRGLVGAEIALLGGILIAASLMTAINPARGVLAINTATEVRPAVAADPYFEMQISDDLMAHLNIAPGTTGENTFTVSLFNLETGAGIDDVSLIRLRFDNRDQDVGQSELRPERLEEGVYEASGANLSIPGDWRIRMTVQRPGEFDKVLDFEANVETASPTPPPVIDTTIPVSDRGAAALLAGYGLLAAGGFFVAQTRLRRLLSGTGILAIALIATGVISMGTGAALVYGGGGAVTAHDAWARPAPAGSTAAVYLTIDNTTGSLARVTAAETDAAASVELHRTVIENEVAQMQALDTLDIPSGGTLRIEPPGTHLMLVDLHRDLLEGATFPLTLRFESGETATLDVSVQMFAPE